MSDGGLHFEPTPTIEKKDVLEEIRFTDGKGTGVWREQTEVEGVGGEVFRENKATEGTFAKT